MRSGCRCRGEGLWGGVTLDGLATQVLCEALAFGAVIADQGGVTRDVVGPVAGASAFAFAAECTFENLDEVAAAADAEIGKFFGPEWQERGEFVAARNVCGMGSVGGGDLRGTMCVLGHGCEYQDAHRGRG